MGKKLLTLLAAAALTVTAACGGSGGNTTDNGASGVAVSQEKVEDRSAEVTLYLTTSNIAEEKFNEQYGNKIRERFPKYTIKYIMQVDSKTLPNLVATGTPVDIVITSDAFTPIFITPNDLQYDLTPLIKKNNTDLTKFEPSTIDIQRAMADGGIWGLPIGNNSASLMYNRDIFDRFGVPYPKDGMTWDQVYELAKTLTRKDGGVQYKGLVMSFQHLLYLNQYSAEFVDLKTNKVKMADEDFKKAVQNLARFFQIPGNELPNNKYALASQTDAFGKNKNAAMYASLSGAPKNEPGAINWGVVQLPTYSDKPGVGPQSYPRYAFVTKMSKDKDAAYKVAEYLASEDYQTWMVQTSQGFSALKDPKINAKFGNGDPWLQGRNIEAFLPKKFAAPALKSKYQTQADKESYSALEAILSGTDINTALREAADRLEKSIAADQGK